MSITITITIPGVGRWDGAASTVRTLAPLVTAALLPVLEEAVPGLGVALAVTRLARLSLSVGIKEQSEPVRALA